MDTVKDFFESLYDNYRDRVKSPFIGSLILSYLAYNWRTVAILLFSDWPMHYRIDWIEQNYCDWDNYVVPFLMSLFYIFGLPHINLGIEWLLKGYTKKRQAKIDALETARLLKRKANAKILREIAEVKAGTSEINTLEQRNASLQVENANLIKQNQDDLERHNKALEQFKDRENDHKDQIQKLALLTDLVSGQIKFTTNTDITLKEVQEMTSVSEKFSNEEKSNYTQFIMKIYNGISNLKSSDIKRFTDLGLIKVSGTQEKRQIVVTRLGSLLYDYLKNGIDLY